MIENKIVVDYRLFKENTSCPIIVRNNIEEIVAYLNNNSIKLINAKYEIYKITTETKYEKTKTVKIGIVFED